MVRCIAVDDEPLALDIISDYVAKVPELTLVASTTNAIEALTLVQNGEVDLVFLDVQMPELTGIQFLKIINGKCDVILTTAYPQYALDGYDLNVVDYLLKPIAFDRFYRSVQKILNNKPAKVQQPVMPAMPNDAVDFIFVKTEHKIQRVDLEDILYIEGLKDYISIYTPDERIVTLQNMKKMEDILPANRFVRVHRSYIVALDKIASIERGRIFIEGKIIPVGDTYRDTFYKYIGDKNS
ncbi:LytR/AlgR family response regulator transcription factor [Parapedobacter koreensis]|uniref:Two component transcriptional regulator, LytTR family n=1 Tax=Parapedobacter koreensis TaxID=332977 RepID=A0A1H7RE85_9SPHI|nr:LytTR family DNA-binding domain-containing protein [Parapedobacter koreensis]SEL58586.1 two component transcriptional regulator, LytTR family [Parapedobacter koreensis]